ncbi:MAG: twin-arginine translocase TatA/TatE family subunit [Chloroflexota bacterium]
MEMPSIGAPELLIILAIVVVLFGATRIGDLGKGLGRGIKEFRKELKDDDDAPKKTETTVTTVTTEDKKPSQSH